jgi:hypothetical protein
MTDTLAVASWTLDAILDQLDFFHQRATYGAVAAVVDTSPRSLMTGREREPRSSWIVSRQTKQPTGYAPEQIHPAIEERDAVLSTPESLRVWLERPQ